jgi:hypothetical protein
MIPGWPYSVIAAVESGRASWTALLDAVRLGRVTLRQASNTPPLPSGYCPGWSARAQFTINKSMQMKLEPRARLLRAECPERPAGPLCGQSFGRRRGGVEMYRRR